MTDIDDDIDWRLLERHLAGECTATETARLKAWLHGEPSRQRLLEQLERIWAHGRSKATGYDPDEAWRELSDKLDPPTDVPVHVLPRRPSAPPKPRRWRQNLVRIAAVLAVAAAGGVISQVAQNWHGGRDEALAMREIVTARGQRATVRLGDGSRVVLGPESRLEAPERFDRSTRTLSLEGEAYFEVARDERRPFLVRSASTVTRVLGTSFALRAYPDDPEVRVVVKTGRVSLESAAGDGPGAVLIPGQAGRLGSDGRVAVESGVDVDAYLDWTRGRLVFEDSPLHSVVADLKRWYDVEITMADAAIADFPLTAAFNRQPLDEVLTVIARSLDVRYVREGEAIEFTAVEPDRQ